MVTHLSTSALLMVANTKHSVVPLTAMTRTYKQYQRNKIGPEKLTENNPTLVRNEPRHEKTCLREFPTRPDTNWPVQPQKQARVLKFWL